MADQPYRVHEGQYNHFVPPQVIGPVGKARPTHLFVRPDGAAAYRYVGPLEPSYMQQAPGPGNHGMAEFELRPTLPSGVWSELGGLLRVGATNAAAVDRALDRLRGPTTVEDRLDVLRELVGYWHGPIRPDDGFAEAELGPLHLPRALKWWYGWAGRRKEIMSGQNLLFAPTDPVHPYWHLKAEDDRLLFYLENQGVYRWGTLPEGDDPPVVGRYEASDPWEPEGITLSEHLILACMFEAVMCHSPYGAAAACLEQRTLSEIAGLITPVAIHPWRWLGPTRFYARGGAFMCSMANRADVHYVWIGAKTERPLQFLTPYLGDAWEYAAV